MITPTPISVEFSDSKATAIDVILDDGNATAIRVEFKSRYKPSKKTDIYLGEGYIGDRISNRLI